MELKNYSFDKLPFSELFRTYIDDFSQLEQFYAANPFEPEVLDQHAETIHCIGERKETVALLKKFNERFDLHENAQNNIERLADERSVALVTGQQLGLYGGPLYTVLKTLTTIHLSAVLEQKLARPVIPVFWLADEDHDYEEIKKVNLLDRDELLSYSLDRQAGSNPPVGDITLGEPYEDFREQVEQGLFETDFTDQLLDLLDRCYDEGVRHDRAFGKLISELFSRHGLVLAGSNCKPVKQKVKEGMKRAISRADEIREALENQSARLEKEYHRQATIYDSNLFYLDDEVGRTKITRNGTSWKTDTGERWSTKELLDLIDQKPERFSPNVFLRPILQDLLVPTIGYVAGPGELAYYGQMKQMYEVFECQMPAIIPRMSGTIIEPAIDRVLDELPFEVGDYKDRIEDLESAYVEQSDQPDIEAIFGDWKARVEAVAGEHKEVIKEVDPTLEGAAGKATAVYFGELDKLKGKVYRSVKQQEETQIKRIRKIKANLFPENVPQERIVSFIYFMNKYGINLWDELLDELTSEETFTQHKLIYL